MQEKSGYEQHTRSFSILSRTLLFHCEKGRLLLSTKGELLSASTPRGILLSSRWALPIEQACQQVVQGLTFRRRKWREGLRDHLIVNTVSLV
jgi:hypothetical protein